MIPSGVPKSLNDPSRPYGAMASAIRVRHDGFFSFLYSSILDLIAVALA